MEKGQKNIDSKTIPNATYQGKEKINVPNLRFGEYTENWSKNRFDQILTFLKNNTLSRAELNYIDGAVKNIHYGDVLIKFNCVVDCKKEQIPYVNNKNAPKNYNEMSLQSGDIIISDTAEDYTVGKACELLNVEDMKIISGLHTIPCRCIKNTFALGYLGYYINSPAFHNQLLPLIQGIKVCSISKSQIIATSISFPSRKEQQKIANFFDLLDQRIQTQSKIIEDLETYKKLISNSLLFGGNIKLNYRKLGSVSCLKNGYAFKSETYVESGKYKILTIANVQGNKFINVENCNSIDILPKDIQSYQVLKKGDILISMTGNVGRVSLCNRDNCLLNQRVGVLVLNNQQDLELIYQCLSSGNFEKNMTQKGQGAAQLNISKIDIENFHIPKNINVNVVKFLALVDEKINIENDYLTKLKEQKKYLLLNMFI